MRGGVSNGGDAHFRVVKTEVRAGRAKGGAMWPARVIWILFSGSMIRCGWVLELWRMMGTCRGHRLALITPARGELG